jgi:hypothetical protein
LLFYHVQVINYFSRGRYVWWCRLFSFRHAFGQGSKRNTLLRV